MVQAYSPSGEFLAEFELDPGPVKVKIDHRFRNICFTGQGIFGMFPSKADPDEIIVLMKTAFHAPITETHRSVQRIRASAQAGSDSPRKVQIDSALTRARNFGKGGA